jgi:4-amino-4-deoxy-L-arabinose transferase-like glycosyltransferase
LRGRGIATALVVVVTLYAVLLWTFIRPTSIREWRPADTQTIARHLAEPGSSILYPRIDWGGDGPGYVETEFQLYPWLVSRMLRIFGDVEWPGELLCLLATLAAAAVVYRGLARAHGRLPAAFGTVALLASPAVIYTATRVQPEALCLLLYVSAWFSFLRYKSSSSWSWLTVYALLGASAMLVKPTAAQLGISSFFLLVFRSPRRLRSPGPWIAWGCMLAALVLYLMHGRSVYLEYGNTFGVLSGGDSKLPRLEHLLTPVLYVKAAVHAVRWGLGVAGAAALAFVLVTRKNVELVSALLIGNVIWTLFALRYTSQVAGNHYHLLGALLAAHAVALVVETAARSRSATKVVPVLGAVLAAALGLALKERHADRRATWDAPVITAAGELARLAHPGDLVVVRSLENRYDSYWRTPNNYQDPRVFYLSRTRGWALGADDDDLHTLEHASQHGARYYVEPVPRPSARALDEWLEAHGTLVATTPFGGRLFALHEAAD